MRHRTDLATVFAGVKRPRKNRAPIVPLTVAQVAAIREAADDDFKLAIDLGARVGVRMSEARGLTLDRVEFLRRRIRIDRQALHGADGWGPPKSFNSDRVIPVTVGLLDEVNRHVDANGVDGDGLLFRGSKSGRMLSYGTWNKTWCSAVDDAGVAPGARFHDLRHHYASEHLGHGVSLVAVATALGDDPKTVLDTYAHLTNSDDDRIRAVDELLWSTDGSEVREAR
jgi:integrase